MGFSFVGCLYHHHKYNAMTVLTKNPNLIQQTKFRLMFTRMKNVTYFCTQAKIPGISLARVDQPSPFVDRPTPGDKLVYDEVDITFNLDEDLTNWREGHDWMRALGKPTDFAERRQVTPPSLAAGFFQRREYSDATLLILTSHNNGNIEVQFKDTFPISLTGIDFDSTTSAHETLTATVRLAYFYYDLGFLRPVTSTSQLDP